ncbi:SusD/RagB family nutrient-binding outer membrane lipoprotein [Marinoscillum furvescens]|uniref:SusD-like starch-binding protein associating with outer membrane n=1 Tax=Marinoscillum furvescens DSM 4134 TaxID=1122208 RepID=A0A3D9KWV4_MARFU|nr:SusD/RagB family nutrient-binding outer membrane lipoprotein [Marinoscillum furvescens]RED92627.1 SusD-like starch-binding protein associating with outer membrane [Marinoscillum furvescens DSM 4134]
MKNYIKTLAIVSALFLSTACEDDFLDVNTDPNASTTVPPGTVMTNSMIAMSQNLLNTLNPNGEAYIQHHKPVVVLTGPDTYNYSPIGNNNFWRFTFYGDIIKDLNLAVLLAEEEGLTNGVAQIRIFQAFAWMIGADTWGEIPFTESNDSEILFPKFDTGDIIYQGIIDILDDAIARIDLADQSFQTTITDYDPLYAGDMNKWLAFANTLKLRALMRVSYVEDRSQEITDLLTGGNEFIDELDGSENAEFAYFPTRSNQNFDYATFDNFVSFGSFQTDAGGNRVHQRWRLASDEMVELLQPANDPRLFSFFQRNINNPSGPIEGAINGAGPLPDEVDRGYVSLFYIRQDKSDEWLLASEYWLLAAEAYERGLAPGGTVAAQEALENGVLASMNHFDGSDFEISAADKQAFLNTLDLAAETDATEFIQIQQYIALFNQGSEAWANWRRTKKPALDVPVGAPINSIISRVEIPNSEIESNINIDISPLIDVPVYFER